MKNLIDYLNKLFKFFFLKKKKKKKKKNLNFVILLKK